LDWDDTIGDWTTAEHKALRDLYDRYHLDALYPAFEDYLAAYKPYNLHLWGLYGQGAISKEKLHFDRFYQPLMVSPDPALGGRDKEELAHEMGDTFLRLTNEHFCLMPDAEQIVRYLASKYPLTIISNGFREVQYYKFEHSGLADCLTYTIISDEIGINKPQPGIFQIALDKNGVRADEAIMIGDSYSSDIQGAKAAGIDQIWIRNEETNGSLEPERTATHIVSRLKDILQII